MKEQLRRAKLALYLAVFAAVCVAIFLGIVRIFHDVDKDKIGDAATWVGALFAGLAFLGTVRIAQSETKSRRTKDAAVGLIAAAEIIDTVVRGHILLEQIQGLVRDHLERPSAHDGNADLEYVHDLIAKHSFVARDDLEKCVALDPTMALSIARAQGALRATHEILKTLFLPLSPPIRTLVLNQLFGRVTDAMGESSVATDRLIELLGRAKLRESK
jgi:hypothetical protein